MKKKIKILIFWESGAEYPYLGIRDQNHVYLHDLPILVKNQKTIKFNRGIKPHKNIIEVRIEIKIYRKKIFIHNT